jgi:hypothetical protein
MSYPLGYSKIKKSGNALRKAMKPDPFSLTPTFMWVPSDCRDHNRFNGFSRFVIQPSNLGQTISSQIQEKIRGTVTLCNAL